MSLHFAPLLEMLSLLYRIEPAPEAHSGIIVALKVPPGVAAQVAQPGGVAAAGLHVTLAFLGSITDQPDSVPFVRVAHRLAELAGQYAPVTAKFGGPGTFNGVAAGQDAQYLSVDGPVLPELREAVVTAVEGVGLSVDRTHGFTPHVTLSYAAPGTTHPLTNPPQESFEFPALELWLAGHHVQFPWSAAPAYLAKADQASSDERRQAQALLAQLGGDLRRLEREDGRLIDRGNQLHQHHRQAADRLAEQLTAVRGSQLESAILHHSAQAAMAERVNNTP